MAYLVTVRQIGTDEIVTMSTYDEMPVIMAKPVWKVLEAALASVSEQHPDILPTA